MRKLCCQSKKENKSKHFFSFAKMQIEDGQEIPSRSHRVNLTKYELIWLNTKYELIWLNTSHYNHLKRLSDPQFWFNITIQILSVEIITQRLWFGCLSLKFSKRVFSTVSRVKATIFFFVFLINSRHHGSCGKDEYTWTEASELT